MQLSINANRGTSPLRQVEDRCHALLCDANYYNRRNDSPGWRCRESQKLTRSPTPSVAAFTTDIPWIKPQGHRARCHSKERYRCHARLWRCSLLALDDRLESMPRRLSYNELRASVMPHLLDAVSPCARQELLPKYPQAAHVSSLAIFSRLSSIWRRHFTNINRYNTATLFAFLSYILVQTSRTQLNARYATRIFRTKNSTMKLCRIHGGTAT